MARRRGFFAELQRQAEIAAREQARRERQAEQANQTAIRAAERDRKAQERAVAQMSRADAVEQKRLAKEAQEAHLVSMAAEVERLNAELALRYEAIDSLLPAALGRDPYVDLTGMRAEVVHPPFDRDDLEAPVPEPTPLVDPPPPKYAPPPAPTGLKAVLGKKAHEKAVAEAAAAHEQAMAAWQAVLPQWEAARQEAAVKRAEAEAARVATLAQERGRYAAECASREAEVAQRNDALETLASDLGYGSVEAVEEYLAIVFSESPYPPDFAVSREPEFDASTAELRLRVLVPGPDKLCSLAAYKYTKSADEITPSVLSQKACRDRYAGAVHHVALRSLHEVFKSDRRGLIKTISLEVGTETIDPATGNERYVPFVAVGAERESFLALELSNVVPAATLEHLGAAVSKKPYDLVSADGSGVRRA